MMKKHRFETVALGVVALWAVGALLMIAALALGVWWLAGVVL